MLVVKSCVELLRSCGINILVVFTDIPAFCFDYKLPTSKNIRTRNTIEYKHFKMESLSFAVQLMRKNCYMASIDLTDAYYTVPVAPEHRIYFRFVASSNVFSGR